VRAWKDVLSNAAKAREYKCSLVVLKFPLRISYPSPLLAPEPNPLTTSSCLTGRGVSRCASLPLLRVGIVQPSSNPSARAWPGEV